MGAQCARAPSKSGISQSNEMEIVSIYDANTFLDAE